MAKIKEHNARSRAQKDRLKLVSHDQRSSEESLPKTNYTAGTKIQEVYRTYRGDSLLLIKSNPSDTKKSLKIK